jgi:hypothetical protein
VLRSTCSGAAHSFSTAGGERENRTVATKTSGRKRSRIGLGLGAALAALALGTVARAQH